MRVTVKILREGGQFSPPPGRLGRMSGELVLDHQSMPHERRTVPVLRVLGNDRALYDPKLTKLGDGKMQYTGLERVGSTWQFQEWWCELI